LKPWHLKLAVAAVLVSYVGYTLAILAISWPIGAVSLSSAEALGNSFGPINAFFGAVATILIVATIVVQQQELNLQREELKLQREELTRMVGTQQRLIHIDLLKQAIEREDLAEVWQGGPVDRTSHRQHLYVNMILTWWEENYVQGLVSEDQTRVLLEKYLGNNSLFRSFWEEAAQAGDRRSYVGDRQNFNRMADAAYRSRSTDSPAT
jgi:hypothetical protein